CYNIHEESPFFVLFFATEIITFPLKGRLSSFIVSGKFPYRVKFYTKLTIIYEMLIFNHGMILFHGLDSLFFP
ncbi:hypothetical protein, partial [Dialister succinatiphilus]|uniref:hypothetical protein n=1 Tax=Dialister succinatiphilus TaxID=487173 RepID=UPI003AF12DCE